MTVPYTFGTATTSIPLSNLDSNFNTPITLGNTSIYLGNTTTTIGNLTLTNATISSGNVTISNISVTTANVTTANVATLSVTGTATIATANITTGNITTLTSTSITDSGLTSGRITYAGASGLLSDSANLAWDNTNVRLGVGTSSPSYKLHLVGSGANANARIESTSTASSQLSFVNTSTSGVGFVVGLNGDSSGNGILYHQDAKDILIYTNTTERMRITSAGLVGIGTSSPSVALEVAGAGKFTAGNVSIVPTTTTSNAAFIATNAGGTFFAGLDNSTGSTFGAGAYGSVLYNGANTPMVFYTNGTERMRVDTSGNVLMGTTSTTVNPGIVVYGGINNAQIQIGHASGVASGEGYIGFQYNGSAIGSITQNGTTGVLFNVTSDQRLKTNIVDAPSGNIDGIKVRSFDWLTDGSHQEYGMVAQELIEVAPYAVNKPENPDDMMAVDYSKLVPMMIKEIQDLKQRIATLENK